MNPFKRRKTKSCFSCGEQISKHAALCEHCGASQPKPLCVVCGDEISPAAKYCKGCNSHQSPGWRIFFSATTPTIAWSTAFLAVFSAVISGGSRIRGRESQTGFKVTGANVGRIHIQAWNSGQKPSMLLSYRLEIDDKTKVDVSEDKLILTPASRNKKQSAEEVEKRIIILKGPPQKIDLGPITGFKATACRPSEKRPDCILRIRDQLRGTTFTLRVQVQESGRWWNTTPHLVTKRDQKVPGDVIEDFFIGACCETPK